MAKRTVSELMVETLESAGVQRIYGVVGDSLNSLTDSLRTRKKIQWMHMRHEEVAAFAAGAEAHLTQSLAVCAGSCGPGNMHLINGLYDCHRSRVPVLAIAAQIPSREIGSGYFQETNPQRLFADCSHYCEMVSTPEQMPGVLESAIAAAVTRRGVAVIVLPGDIGFSAAATSGPSVRLQPTPSPVVVPSAAEIAQAAKILNGARKVTILGGAGCAGAHASLVELADKLKAPIVHSLRGKEHIEYDNPFDVGMTGLLGFASGYYAMMDCEVLLLLGTDFPYRQFYPEKAKIIQIDLRGENLGRRSHLDLGLIGDIRATLPLLTAAVDAKSERVHLDRSVQHYHKTREGLDDLAGGTPGKKPIHPQYLTAVVNRLANADTVFTCDVGTPTVWAARYLTMNGKRRLLGSFNHGSMANAMPQAIGAQAALPGRQVISLSGDGGFSMLMGDLLTLRQLNLPVKIVIYNNSTLGFVELEMRAAGLLEFGTDLKNPNFAELAKAVGIFGVRLEDPGEVEAGVRAALSHEGPAVIDAVVNPLELSMPPSIQAEQALGFSLYLIKAVMDGRGASVIDLARTNLFR